MAACSGVDNPIQPPALTPSEVPAASPTPVEIPTENTTDPISLRIWVPPQFDPTLGSPAADLLAGRLEEFMLQNPRVRIEVRVKNETGAGSLLASLAAAQSAAPLAIPDIVALSRADLESAAIKGLIEPIDGRSTALEDPGWFEFGSELVYVQENSFGLPFAGDALFLIYRPSKIASPPLDLASALQIEEPLSFPAADSNSLFTLLLYRSAGARLNDAEGRPTLDTAALTEVLTFFENGSRSGLLPFWLTQYDTDRLALDAYLDNQAQMAVTWASNYLADPPIDTLTSSLPTTDGRPFTFTRGWVWALAANQSAQQETALQLIEFLSDTEFLANWTLRTGYLPTHRSSLEAWPDSPMRALLGQILESSEIIPPTDLLSSLGPALQEATIAVLKEQSTPVDAARKASESVINR